MKALVNKKHTLKQGLFGTMPSRVDKVIEVTPWMNRYLDEDGYIWQRDSLIFEGKELDYYKLIT